MKTRIYVADLQAYNNGTLYGKWIDADQSEEEILEEIQEMLKNSPYPNSEEWAIHDYEGFGNYSISEHESIENVSQLAQSINEHGEAFTLYASDVGFDYALEHFEEAYQGEWDSEEDFAENLIDDLGYLNEIPEHLQFYFDYEKFTRDLFINDYVSFTLPNYNVAVFNRNV